MIKNLTFHVISYFSSFRQCCFLFGIGIWSLVILSSLSPAFAQDASYDQYIGEMVRYDVRSLAMKMADAHIELKGKVDLDGRKAYLITFEAKGANFYDREKIYADIKDLYPLRIERDVNYLGSIEKITEVYDQDKFVVTVTKTTKAKPQPEMIILKKKARIDNLYCFIYRYRLMGSFRLGSSLELNLPTKDVSVKIVKNTKIKIADRMYNAFLLETTPAQYRLWFDTSQERVLLRIDKSAMVGGTSMIMTKYEKTR